MEPALGAAGSAPEAYFTGNCSRMTFRCASDPTHVWRTPKESRYSHKFTRNVALALVATPAGVEILAWVKRRLSAGKPLTFAWAWPIAHGTGLVSGGPNARFLMS